jgi:hypothetical protein
MHVCVTDLPVNACLVLMAATLMGIATLTAVSLTSVGFSDTAVAQGCCTQTNGGGNVPNGSANGVPNTNRGGNAPPGQQGG